MCKCFKVNHRILVFLLDKWLVCCRQHTACLDQDTSLLNCEWLISIAFLIHQTISVAMKNYLKLYKPRYSILTECWEEEPQRRPTFRWLCSAVRRLLDDHKVCKVFQHMSVHNPPITFRDLISYFTSRVGQLSRDNPRLS